MMAVFFFIAHEKGFKLHAQPKTGAYSGKNICCQKIGYMLRIARLHHGSAFLPSILKYGIVFTFCLQSVDNKWRFVQLGVKYVNDVLYY